MFFVLAKCCTVDSKCKDKYLHILCYLYIHTVVILCGYMWLRICLCICIYLFICMSFYVHTSWYKCLILYAIPAPLPKSAHRNDQSWFDGSIFGFLTLWSWRIHFQDVCVTQTKTGTKRRGPSLQEGVCVCVYICMWDCLSPVWAFAPCFPVLVQWQMQLKRVGFDGEKIHRALMFLFDDFLSRNLTQVKAKLIQIIYVFCSFSPGMSETPENISGSLRPFMKSSGYLHDVGRNFSFAHGYFGQRHYESRLQKEDGRFEPANLNLAGWHQVFLVTNVLHKLCHWIWCTLMVGC